MNTSFFFTISALLISIISLAFTTSCVSTSTEENYNIGGIISYPIAKPVLNQAGQPIKDRFISPYPPYNPIDTKGYTSGNVVGDPSTAKRDSKTGKIIPSTAKVFRLP